MSHYMGVLGAGGVGYGVGGSACVRQVVRATCLGRI